MTPPSQADQPDGAQPDDGQLLSAYLRDDLSAADSAAVEARLASDPQLGERLDRLHASLAQLRRLEEPEPPAGFAERMEARTGTAWEAHRPTATSSEPAAAPTGGRVLMLDRRRVQRRWLTLSSAAAGVVLVLVAGLSLVAAPQGGDEVALESAERDTRTTAQEPRQETGGDAADGGEADVADGGEEAGVAESDAADADEEALTFEDSGAPGPVVLDEQIELDGEAAVRLRAAQAAETAAVLGLGRAEAAGAAATAVAALRRDPVAVAIGAADCADAVETAAGGPIVITRAESASWDGRDAILYLAVSASPGSPTLDQPEAWVVEAGSCTTSGYVLLP